MERRIFELELKGRRRCGLLSLWGCDWYFSWRSWASLHPTNSHSSFCVVRKSYPHMGPLEQRLKPFWPHSVAVWALGLSELWSNSIQQAVTLQCPSNVHCVIPSPVDHTNP